LYSGSHHYRDFSAKDHKQVKWTAAIGMGLQLINAATLIILFLLERKAGNTAEMLFVKILYGSQASTSIT
jgi:hypothetical protein